MCLHNNTGDHTIATFKNTVKIQWEASLYDSTTSLSDCSISTDEIDVALGIRSLKTLTEFLSELLPGTVQPAATSNSQSTLTQIPHSTMKGLEWLNRDIYTEAEESLSGKIDFRRLSELTDMVRALNIAFEFIYFILSLSYIVL